MAKIKMKEVRKNSYVVVVKQNGKVFKFNFKLNYFRKKFSSSLTKAILELKEEIEEELLEMMEERVEISMIDLYDELLEASQEQLPGIDICY